jgi:hypothetical protein
MPSCHTRNTCEQIAEYVGPEPTGLQLLVFIAIFIAVPSVLGWLMGAWAFKTWPFEKPWG